MEIQTKYAHTSNYTKGRSSTVQYIVLHYTANTGDTAKNNCTYFQGKNRKASANYFVDETSVWQSVKDTDTAWHCGGSLQGSGGHAYYGKCKNANSIGIEMCNSVSGVPEAVEENALWLVRQLMAKYNVPVEHVIRHYDVTGKECPKPWVWDNAAWLRFKNKIQEDENVAQTVMKLDEIWVQEINPLNLQIKIVDKKKKDIDEDKYFNLGFFSGNSNTTVPVGNLAIDGKIITQAKDNESWINLSKHNVSTLWIDFDGNVGITATDDLTTIPKLKNAVSGVPIIAGGIALSMNYIKTEGWSGDECYNTWHGFLGIRHNKLVYVAMNCGFSSMVWNLVALGIYDAIKLDGGGSFILHDEKDVAVTTENRRIHNIGCWT